MPKSACFLRMLRVSSKMNPAIGRETLHSARLYPDDILSNNSNKHHDALFIIHHIIYL